MIADAHRLKREGAIATRAAELFAYMVRNGRARAPLVASGRVETIEARMPSPSLNAVRQLLDMQVEAQRLARLVQDDIDTVRAKVPRHA